MEQNDTGATAPTPAWEADQSRIRSATSGATLLRKYHGGGSWSIRAATGKYGMICLFGTHNGTLSDSSPPSWSRWLLAGSSKV
jgi:hypothetical protein